MSDIKRGGGKRCGFDSKRGSFVCMCVRGCIAKVRKEDDEKSLISDFSVVRNSTKETLFDELIN